MFTAFTYPILCALSSACTITPGVHVISANTTVLAAVSVIPVQHAVKAKTATRHSVSV